MRSLSIWFVSTLWAFSAVPANAAWYEAKSKHFIIFADQSPKTLGAFATKLEKFDKAVRIARRMDDPPIGEGGRVTIFVLNSTDAVSKLLVGKRSNIAGFYIPRAGRSVAFVPREVGSGQEWDATADTVFFHEYAHHLMLQNTDAALPPWLVEGFAEFLSTAQFPPGGGVSLGTPANHRMAGLYLLAKPHIEVLLGEGPKKTTPEQDEAFYGWAWVLTHYLTFDKDRTGQLHTYVDAINRGEDLMGAATHTFGDLKQLDRDMDRYLHVNRFTYLKINSPDFNNIAVSVRPLRPGEAAIMPTQIRSARGVDKKTAPEVAALARAAASSYPSDPAVQRELAEAEFDAGNYAASRDAAVRTLAIDPKLEKALIYKGRAEMELASSDRKAGWNAIRQNFLDANKLDTEDAEPLFFYYESFARAGQGPTANAMAGLLYALDLAPQDKGLRMTAVAAMIAGGRLAEARAALAPIAFDPHSSKGREQARKIMDALGSKDEKTAMAALESFTPDDEE